MTVPFDGDLDAGLLSPVRAGTPVEEAVSDRAWLQAMLDAEAALARAQARTGTIPSSASAAITAAARADQLDLRALACAARETANPVVGLVQALTRAVAEDNPEAAEYVHRGSTSQDVLDTGAMLVCSRVLRIVQTDLRRTAQALERLSAQHRDTLMAGRTLTLHAVPITFGLKTAGWRQLVLNASERVDRVLDGGLPISLGGAAGTLAGYVEYAALDGRGERPSSGEYLDRLTAAFAEETGLARTVLPWHALRTPVVDVASVLAFVTGTLGKIAVDVQSLGRTEVEEVREPVVADRGGSSAMPHKRNPVLATLVRSASLQVPALASALTQCMVTEDERSAGAWHAEWHLLRECLRLAGGAAHTAVELAEGLEVRPDRMRANLKTTESMITSERVAAVLAPLIGKGEAKRLLTEAIAEAESTGRSLSRILAGIPAVAIHLDERTLTGLLDPASYTGAAGLLVDRALARDSTSPMV